MKGRLKRTIVMLLTAVMIMGATLNVSAASGAVIKSVKNSSETTSLTTASKNATTVTKGTTRLRIAGGRGFVKFTAPKTGTYSFMVSNVQGQKKMNACASVGTYIAVPPQKLWTGKVLAGYLKEVTVSTAGGRASYLRLISNKKMTRSSGQNRYLSGTRKYLPSRTGTIKLNKGQTIYLYFSNLGDGRTTANLVIR